jgi:hypothetical protein
VNFIKYIYTYSFKGGDHVMAALDVLYLIKMGNLLHHGMRLQSLKTSSNPSCGTAEVCWTLYGCETNMLYTTSQILDVHLENQHREISVAMRERETGSE